MSTIYIYIWLKLNDGSLGCMLVKYILFFLFFMNLGGVCGLIDFMVDPSGSYYQTLVVKFKFSSSSKISLITLSYISCSSLINQQIIMKFALTG